MILLIKNYHFLKGFCCCFNKKYQSSKASFRHLCRVTSYYNNDYLSLRNFEISIKLDKYSIIRLSKGIYY